MLKTCLATASLLVVATTAAANAQTAAGAWTLFADPVEHAFTADVPQDWTVNGGTFRISPIVATQWLTALSPDKGTLVFFGDPEIPGFRTPQPNQSEGMRVPAVSPELPPVIVLNYRPGAAFAELYAPRHLALIGCNDANLMRTAPMPDLAGFERQRAAEEIRTISNFTPPQNDAGLAIFSCQMSGISHVAAVIADTVQPVAGGSWRVRLVAGFITEPEKVSHTWSVLEQVLASRQWNPRWDDAMARETLKALQQQNWSDYAIEQNLIKTSWDFTNMIVASQAEWSQQQTIAHNQFMAGMAAQSAAISANFVNDQRRKEFFTWQVTAFAHDGELVQNPVTGRIFELDSDIGRVFEHVFSR